MQPLKLHTKATLVASAVTIGMLIVAMMVTGAGIAGLERDDDKALAELQAISLAAQVSDLSTPQDVATLERAVNVVMGSRPNLVTVRIWDRSGGEFVARVAASGSAAVEEIPQDTKEALRSGLASKVVSSRPYGSKNSLYRVFVPIRTQGRLSGAVEIVERFDSNWSVALRYARKTFWMSLIAILLITIGNYLLFRQLVYRPIGHLFGAMSRAKAGDLGANVPPRAADELGVLSNEFNSMIRQVREMTREREAQQVILEQRVHEATEELEQRNRQLQETNLELWRTTRRMNELGRLAAAGQTAAQFAHEVGTPLNLISGHVQLLELELPRIPGDGDSRIKIIEEQIERIERIVRRMLDRTRFEMELTPVDLNQLLRRLFDATSPAFDKRPVRIIERFDPRLPMINGSADRLQQLFLNLINNALDAMPNGGELTVSTHQEVEAGGKSTRVVVDFADDGSGMGPETVAHIFDPLYTTKAPGQGTGLGLVIVNQIVHEHGGDVGVQSEPGQGTRFRLTFPVTKLTAVETNRSEAVDRNGERKVSGGVPEFTSTGTMTKL
jgi:two-component system, NtrC family, sensor kinase